MVTILFGISMVSISILCACIITITLHSEQSTKVDTKMEGDYDE